MFMYSFVRAVIRFILPFFYSVRIDGKEVTPNKGGYIAVANHVSYLDAPVIAALMPRNMRFVMYWEIYQTPVITHIFKAMKIIPIASPTENKKIYMAAKKEIIRALKDGEGVFIFPEGAITRTGELGEIKKGTERFAKQAGVPVVSYRLNGLWGSVFSRHPDARFSLFSRRKVQVERLGIVDCDECDSEYIRNKLSQ